MIYPTGTITIEELQSIKLPVVNFAEDTKWRKWTCSSENAPTLYVTDMGCLPKRSSGTPSPLRIWADML